MNKTLLQVNSSLFANEGQSTRLADEFVAAWQAANPDAQVRVRDLAREPIGHLDAETFMAFTKAPAARTAAEQRRAALSDTLIDELKAADLLVIGLPMYNFGVPSTLKAYFDHIARAGVTFRYTHTGSEGLLRGKRAVVFTARGGHYAGTPGDSQTPFVRSLLGLLGIDDVTFVHAEGLARGEGARRDGLGSARSALRQLVDAPQETLSATTA